MARRRRFGRSRRSRGGFNIAKALVAANAVYQIAEPVVRAGALDRLKDGDLKGAADALRTGAKEAASTRNLFEAAAPAIAYGVGKKLLGMFGVRSPRVGKVTAF